MRHPLTILLFTCFASITFAEAQLIDQIMSLDTNGDGKLSKSELPPQFRDQFEIGDLNNDGALEKSEMISIFTQIQATRGTTKKIPEGVRVKKNISYQEGNPKWKLDLYLPDGNAPAEGWPALVCVHGGGWQTGDKGSGNWSTVPAQYAANGYVAISVNYRLYPEVGMLDCIDDVQTAVRWLRANAGQYEIDKTRIGAFGISAGAHLVSMLGLKESDPEANPNLLHPGESSLVQAVCAVATPGDFSNWKGTPNDPGIIKPLTKGKGTLAERALAAAPIHHVNREAPPFLIIHAKDDSVVPFHQGKALSESLERVQADVTFLSFESGGHGVFTTRRKDTVPAMQQFFDRILK